jgi:hypothetical protein
MVALDLADQDLSSWCIARHHLSPYKLVKTHQDSEKEQKNLLIERREV